MSDTSKKEKPEQGKIRRKGLRRLSVRGNDGYRIRSGSQGSPIGILHKSFMDANRLEGGDKIVPYLDEHNNLIYVPAYRAKEFEKEYENG